MGGDLASTRVAKPKVHVEQTTKLVKPKVVTLIADNRKPAANDAFFAAEKEVA